MVKLGVIGCGGIATHQLKSVWPDGLFELVAGADIRPEQLEAFRQAFGLQRGYADYRDLLRDEAVEAVMICTPTWLHAEMAIAAAAAGKPTFLQKPMAMCSYDCVKIARAFEAAGLGLQIGFVRRFDSDWWTLKRVVDSGELGRPLVWRQIAGGTAPARPFFMDRIEGGGPLIDGMVHNYDFATHCFGEPVWVKSNPCRIRPDTTAVDTGTVLIGFEHGDQVMASWSWGLPAGVRASSATDVIGPNGVLFFPGSYDAAKVEGKIDPATEGAYLMVLKDGVEKVIPFTRGAMFRDELRHFAEWVSTGGTPRVVAADGLRATRIAELALGGGGMV
ncbi:MAG: Gfo/Idh/MocA family oxidoreductase [Lentisphaerae bacterium]|nr:Gfo/Idh/MocA family oxidoreductase [Lentisphaerota bacterium]